MPSYICVKTRVKISGGDPEHNDPSDKAKMSSKYSWKRSRYIGAYNSEGTEYADEKI